jgi:hypothetical protein
VAAGKSARVNGATCTQRTSFSAPSASLGVQGSAIASIVILRRSLSYEKEKAVETDESCQTTGTPSRISGGSSSWRSGAAHLATITPGVPSVLSARAA